MIPHQAQAERDLIGAMLLTDDARRTGLESCVDGDFHDPACRNAFAAIAALTAQGSHVDPTTVAASSGVDRTVLLRWHGDLPASWHARTYARIVAETAALRRAVGVVEDVRLAAEEGDLARVEHLLADAPERVAPPTGSVEPGTEASQLASTTWEHRWLIPDLLERADRVMVVGGEGQGKSLLARQFAVQCSAGIHPWSRGPMPRLRVLIVDLENSDAQISRSLQHLLRCAGDRYAGTLFVKSRRQGMDLTTRRDVRWLDALMGHHSPDLCIVGPLYKAYRGSDKRAKSSEESAEAAAASLDELRVKHDCALWIESHAGHGSGNDRDGWRPTGSSLWLRWPEFGLGMKPITFRPREMQLVRWRGDRETGRDWPEFLVEGPSTGWPWLATERREAA